MKKSKLLLLVLFVTGCITACQKADITEADKDRIEFVKETLQGYGMEIDTEITPDTLNENDKNTDDLVSFGKRQLYELLCGKKNNMEAHSLLYHKFENSKTGKDEAERLFNALKDSAEALPDSTTEEKTDLDTGSKLFISRSKTADNTETDNIAQDGENSNANNMEIDTDITVVMIYDAEKYEVASITSFIKLPSDSVDTMTDNIMMDLGWSY
jgi:hypothetical protein